jgi:hypothetical protein
MYDQATKQRRVAMAPGRSPVLAVDHKVMAVLSLDSKVVGTRLAESFATMARSAGVKNAMNVLRQIKCCRSSQALMTWPSGKNTLISPTQNPADPDLLPLDRRGRC